MLTKKKTKKNCVQQKACKRYQSLSKEEKEEKRQYEPERNTNLLENEKQNLFQYKKYHKMRKKCLSVIIRNYFHLGNSFVRVRLI